MTENEFLEKIEAQLETDMEKVIPLNRIDAFLEKIGKEKLDKSDIKSYAKKFMYMIYDFRRPDKFSRDQIRTLSVIHETFSRLSTVGLSAHVRSECMIHVCSVDQMTYEEFLRLIPNPATLAVINMNPLKGSALLEIDPVISYSIIDRLLGGPGMADNSVSKKDLSEIEQAVIEMVIVNLLRNIGESWKNIIDLKPQLGRLEVNPAFTMIVPPSDMIVLVSMEMSVNGNKGFMNLCLPYLTIEPVIPKLSGKFWYTSHVKKNINHRIEENISDIKMPVKIGIKSSGMSLKKIYNLKKRDMIALPGFDDGEYVMYSGKPVMRLKKNKTENDVFEFSVVHDRVGNDWKTVNDEHVLNKDNDIQDDVSEVTAKFSNAIDKLNYMFSRLSSRQDEILDTLGFMTGNSEDKDVQDVLRPFHSIGKYDIEDILVCLKNELPQTIALILSYLESGKAANIISILPEFLKPEVIKRIALMDRTGPEILKDIERILEKKLSIVSSNSIMTAGGVNAVAEIIDLVDRQTERMIVEKLEKEDPVLAEEIKKRVFVFEDIVLVDEKSIKKIIEASDKDDLAISLKSVGDDVKKKIFSGMKKNDIEEIEKALIDLGPVKVTKIEEAQKRIVDVIRELEVRGEISITRPDEEVK